MSKLKEALKAINATKDSGKVKNRNNEQKVERVSQGDRSDVAESKRRMSRVPKEISVFQVSDDQSEEPTPAYTVHVEPAELVRAGLAPSAEDLDVIGQQFRRIKRPILRSAFEVGLPTGQNANVIMMASALPNAGKSFCAYNLAQSISLEQDVGVVIVDADVLKPGLSSELGLQDKVGLTDFLVNPKIGLEEILVGTNLNDIVIIPSGKLHPQATELLASRRMRSLISTLSDKFKNRVVIFDAPPLLLTSEAQILSRIVGQIVIVIEDRISSQDSVIRAVELLDRDKPINAILNKSRSAIGPEYDGASYGYYSYSSAEAG